MKRRRNGTRSSTFTTATTSFPTRTRPTARAGGWGTTSTGAGKGFIAVGVECNHEGNGRLIEYYPFGEPVFGAERGLGDVYMRWVVEELKPYIDAHYRTLPGRESAMIGGSSMGGLMAAYSAIRN